MPSNDERWLDAEAGPVVRPYALTQGRTRHTGESFDLVATVMATRTFADLAVRWQLDVILVVGLRLGCLNHALLTAEAIEARGLKFAGWVGNSVDPNFERREANMDTLRSRLAAKCLGLFPYAPEAGALQLSNGFLFPLPE